MSKKIGLIGWPVAHSFSRVLFEKAFATCGLHGWEYHLIPIAPQKFVEEFPKFSKQDWVGCNVTTPYKEHVLSYTQPTRIAKTIGACNVVQFDPKVTDLNCVGYSTNTDVIGFQKDLLPYTVSLQNKKVIVLGAGGAARCAMYVLYQMNCSIMVINRSIEKAKAMCQTLNIPATIGTFQDTEKWEPSCIVQCTTVGMWPNIQHSIWPENIEFPKGCIVYDMVYRPKYTKFLQRAKENGNFVIPGIGMLVHQAIAGFEIFTQIQAEQRLWPILSDLANELY